jgi:signal transduction histidine kinase
MRSWSIEDHYAGRGPPLITGIGPFPWLDLGPRRDRTLVGYGAATGYAILGSRAIEGGADEMTTGGWWFERLSVAQRFLLGSLVILLLGMAGVGAWVSRQIEDGVIHRTAAATALYVDSLIAPSLQDLTTADTLSPEAVDRLDWLFADTPLGQEVTAFQVWDRDGRIVYSTMPDLTGQAFPVEDDLAAALGGGVVAAVGEAEGGAALPSEVSQRDLIEIYSPVRDRDTGAVIAAAEFYYAADDLRSDLAAAQRRSWLAVGGATLLIYGVLATFIRGVSDTIRRQQRALAEQVTQLTAMLRQNQELHRRVRGAAERTAALNERFLRRFSAELHDGPAQEISLALLRLDHVAALCGAHADNGAAKVEMERELDVIQASLRRSLSDVRATSSGLLLPHLGELTVAQTVDHVVRGHQRRTGSAVEVTLDGAPAQAPLATKIALYRIVQEALTNVWRHAQGATPSVAVSAHGEQLRVEIADAGAGFEPSLARGSEAHLGLVGMRERAESLGGQFRVESAPGRGARLTADLPLGATGEADG